LPTHNLKNYLFFISFNLVGFLGHSQLNNSSLFNIHSDSLRYNKQGWAFSFDNLNYIRNTEYHSDIEQGATWAGSQFWPSLNYQYNKNFHIKAGVFIQKDIGNSSFRTLIPTYTVCYTKKNLKVNFGTLDGSLDHKLIEPLYAMENFIDKRIENGIQVKGKFKRLTFDQWLDWEKMIYRTSKSQEMFTVGFSGNVKLIDKENTKLKVPIQMVGRHLGGEIYAQPHGNIKTQFNFAYGLHLTKKLTNQLIDKIDFQGYATFYEDIAPSKADSFLDGTGQYLALTFYHKYFGVMLNYWDAHQYISPLGEPYYVSKSREFPGDYRQYRKMYMLRLLYERKINDNFSLVARLNNIYDLSEKAYNNSVEVFFRFKIIRSRFL
jgi:hypothetical protein